jgi:hypothetical protein
VGIAGEDDATGSCSAGPGVENRSCLPVRIAVACYFLQQNRARTRRFFLFVNADFVPEDEYTIFAVDKSKRNYGRARR